MDDITYTSTSPAGVPDTTKQVTDEHVTRGHMPIVKLAYSADGSATLASVDADGVLVNLGANNDVTVTGTVTANLAAGTNNIGDVDVLSIAAGDNNIGNVDIVTVPSDPFGANADAAATAGSTGTIQAKLRLMTSQLDSVKTAVETLDNAISGSEMQVDVVAALPAGTNNIGDVDVLSVVPGTGATNSGKAEDAAHTTGDTGVALLAVRRDTAAVGSDTDGDYSTVNVDGSGRVWVHDPLAEALLTTIDADTGNMATSLSVLDDWDETDRAKVNIIAGQAGVTAGAGAVAANTQRVTLASDDPAVTALQILDNAISGNEMQVDVVAALPAGTNNIGDVDVLTIAAGTNAIGNVGVIPRTTGGLTTYHLVSAATTNATVVKNAAGQLFGWYIYNNATSMRKVAFHNSSSAPTAGASIFFTINVPASSAANVFSETGIAFSSGIAITTVTDVTDAGATAVALNDLTINLFYA